VRLLARGVLAALAGVGAALAFEPYHWVYLLPLAVTAVTLLSVTAPGPPPAAVEVSLTGSC